MAESLGLVNSGVQGAAGQPLQEGLEGLWMEELPTRTAAHGFTHPAGPTSDNCLHSPEGLFSDSTHCSLGRTGSPQRRSLRKKACLHSVLSSG